MTKKKLIFSVVTISLLVSMLVFAQERTDFGLQTAESILRIAEAEMAARMHELELKNSELEVNKATVEIEKAKLRVVIATEQGAVHEVEFAKLELKQVEIDTDMRKAHSEMVALKLKLAKARLDHIRLSHKPKG